MVKVVVVKVDDGEEGIKDSMVVVMNGLMVMVVKGLVVKDGEGGEGRWW